MVIAIMSGTAITKIMLVDDEPDITFVFKHGLESSGLEVDAFNDPEEALKSFQPGKYNLLITDIKMPKMTGFELYRQVRMVDDKTKVAFITAFDVYRDEFTKMFPDLDVKCFITKPTSINDLVKKVNDELQDTKVSDAV
jgi:DNA-binding response OmpR family regulator